MTANDPRVITADIAPNSPDVVLDNTLGQFQPVIGPNYTLTASQGALKGTNLFFSFSQFSLATNESATFSGPSTVTDVFVRVTGNAPSTIDGTLACTIPNAGFFFMNPAGVTLTANAGLNLQGSFALTTANYLRLADGTKFTSAPGPGDAMLTAAAPAAFGFLSSAAGPITLTGCFVQLNPGTVFSLVGGNIVLNNANVFAQSGRVNIVATASPGEAVFNPVDPGSAVPTNSFAQLGSISMLAGTSVVVSGILGLPAFSAGGSVEVQGGDIQLNSAKIVDVTFGLTSGGPIDIQAGESLTLQGGFLSTSIGASAGNLASAGNINVSAPSIAISQGGQIVANTLGAGAGGAITLTGGSIAISQGGQIAANAFGAGNGGAITLTGGPITIDGADSQISAANTGLGLGGQINISATSLQITNGGQITASASGGGNGGAITLTGGPITIDGINSQISAANSGAGLGGQINISATSLQVSNGAQITAQTEGPAIGGNIQVNAATINIVGTGTSTTATGIFADTAPGSAGNGGAVQISATTLAISSAGVVSTTTFGSGSGGSVIVDAGSITLQSGQNLAPFTGLGSNTETPPATYTGPLPTFFGSGGDVSVKTDKLTIYPGAAIAANTFTDGNGGTINVNAGSLLIQGSGPSSETGIYASTLLLGPGGGTGGDIHVVAESVQLVGGGMISANTMGSGAAGSITVTTTGATAAILLDADSQITSSSTGAGNAGSVTIADSGVLNLDAASSVAATSTLSAGGDITITAGKIQIRNGAQISAANTGQGLGGQININATSLRLDDGMITVSTPNAGGSLLLKAHDVDLFARATLSATAGEDGNISLLAPGGSVFIQHSVVTAQAFDKGGGTIFIDPNFVFLENSIINGKSAGKPVDVVFDPSVTLLQSQSEILTRERSLPPMTDLSGAFIALPSALPQSSLTLAPVCAPRLDADFSSFVVTGQGGRPPQPGGWVPDLPVPDDRAR